MRPRICKVDTYYVKIGGAVIYPPNAREAEKMVRAFDWFRACVGKEEKYGPQNNERSLMRDGGSVRS